MAQSPYRQVAWAFVLLGLRPLGAQGVDELYNMGFGDFMKVKVVSASQTIENISETPATVIVLTREDLEERGYTELSEMLSDLPEMQVVRPYGDTYFKNYWRGYRNNIGEPYLLMVDGVTFNHLYFNTADSVMAPMPLTNVERVEVIYGPASTLYGAQGFIAVINVVTVKDLEHEGQHVRARLTTSTLQGRILDFNYFKKTAAYRFSLTARLDDGQVDDRTNESYEYTKNKYFADRRLWGGFVDNPSLGGAFDSPHHNRALDLRLFFGGTELGFQYYLLNAGLGVEYAGDKQQNVTPWIRPDLSFHLRHQAELAPGLTGTTLIRYRESDVRNDSYNIDAFFDTTLEKRVAAFSYWQSLNFSWSFFQEFEWRATEKLSVVAGLKSEWKDLQKAYDLIYGPYLPTDQIDANAYPFPARPAAVKQDPNRIHTEDVGGFLQFKYRTGENGLLNIGLRSERNTSFGSVTTLRAGYVGLFRQWTYKVLYGEAAPEPVPRLLYGGWKGSGSDPNLKPEESKTWEFDLSRDLPQGRLWGNVYRTINDKTITNTAAGAQNLGMHESIGFSLGAQRMLTFPAGGALKVWAYYSRILRSQQSRTDGQTGTIPIGDISPNTAKLGLTYHPNPTWFATLLARAEQRRPTVASNPISSVAGHVTVDAVAEVKIAGFNLGLKIQNLLDQRYFDPGIRDAGAGVVPGRFDDQGNWVGAQSYFNSLLPQPGRHIFLTLKLEL